MLQDIRFALRLLVKNLGFTVVAITTLGLAVAANAVVFSIVNTILIRPLPYANPDRLVRAYTQFPSLGQEQFYLSAPEYLDLAHDARSYESVAAWHGLASKNLTGADQPVSVNAAYATSNLISTLGVSPMLGRFFDASESEPGDPRAAVLSYGLYNRVFGADRNIVGRTIYVDALPVTVVGVMPKGFAFPEKAELWLPLAIDPAQLASDRRYGNHRLEVMARLKPGVTLEEARAELDPLMRGWGAAHALPEDAVDPQTHPIILRELQPDKVGSVRVALWTLQAAVVFVLLIACANISNLLLARAEARSGEIAVRAALGASRTRIMRQFLTESLVLGLLGAGLGIVLAMWGLDAALAFLPDGVPRENEIRLDTTMLVFAVIVSMATSLVFGLAPILHTHGDLAATLRAAGQRTTDSLRKQLFRRVLIVVEVSLAIVLVIGAGLMIRSFVRLQRVDLGFDPRNLVTLEVQLPEKSYPADADVLGFWSRFRDGAERLPGVRSATLMRELPPKHRAIFNGFHIVGRTELPGQEPNVDNWQFAGDEFFSTMSIGLVEGRLFVRTDDENAPPVVLVNQRMARKFWPNESPIGRRIEAFPIARAGESPLQQTIVGIVADARQQGLDAPMAPELYFPLRQVGNYGDGSKEWSMVPRKLHLVLRADRDPRAMFGTLRAYVSSLDESLPVANLETMDDVLYEAVARPRFVTMLLTVFAGTALVMAAIGIFGVMSYSVERRTKELSIRMALGADAGRLQRMLVLEGLRLAALGIALGLAITGIMTVAFDHWIGRLLFDIGGLDPATYALVILITTGVAALACYIPARRATHIHPMTAMRHE